MLYKSDVAIVVILWYHNLEVIKVATTQHKFAVRLKKAMEKNRIEGYVLAEEIGVTAQAISNYLNEKNFPDTKRLVAICKYLHISLDELFENDVTSYDTTANYQIISALRNLSYAASNIGCFIEREYDASCASVSFKLEFSDKSILRQLVTDHPDDVLLDELRINDEVVEPVKKTVFEFMRRWERFHEMLHDGNITKEEYDVLIENTLEKCTEMLEMN